MFPLLTNLFLFSPAAPSAQANLLSELQGHPHLGSGDFRGGGDVFVSLTCQRVNVSKGKQYTSVTPVRGSGAALLDGLDTALSVSEGSTFLSFWETLYSK